jgi:hypothetical protein
MNVVSVAMASELRQRLGQFHVFVMATDQTYATLCKQMTYGILLFF